MSVPEPSLASNCCCDGCVVRTDIGCTWPLWLPTPLEDCLSRLPDNTNVVHLQHLVDAWQQHAGVGAHALLQVPPVLLIQVNRFGAHSSSLGPLSPRKSQVQIQPDPYLMLPYFNRPLDQPNALEALFAQFQLSAALLHEGPRADMGHYRAVLYEEGLTLLTNDSVAAKRFQDSVDGVHCRSNYYAFLYTRCSSP